jgi:prevent-host-death family protein
MTSPAEHVSVTEAARRGIARLVADAAHGGEVVVERHGRPVAAVIGLTRLQELEALRDDVRDLALALARVADDGGGRVGLGEALGTFRPGGGDRGDREDDRGSTGTAGPAARADNTRSR